MTTIPHTVDILPDGKQPGPCSRSPAGVQAALIPRPAVSGGFGGKPSIPSEDAGGVKMDGANRPGRAPLGAHTDTQSPHAVTFPHPHINSSQCAATQASSLTAPPLLFDPAFLAAWRESQGQTVDAIARR